MKPTTKVSIGVPYFGRQEAIWWANLVSKVALFPNMGLEFGGMHLMGAMLTDKNRNHIARSFLEGDSEWLFWIDADTNVPNGAIPRLLDLDTTLASGIYYGKGKETKPIAYIKIPETGAYRPLHEVYEWERGEIVPVDACGFGAILTHRSVFEDIQKAYMAVQRKNGGVFLMKKEDIQGKIVAEQVNKSDNKVIQGQLRTRIQPVTMADYPFPFFILEYGRTEDMAFFEVAAEVGHKPFLDTSIEAGHIDVHEIKGKNYREARIYEQIRKARETESS